MKDGYLQTWNHTAGGWLTCGILLWEFIVGPGLFMRAPKGRAK